MDVSLAESSLDWLVVLENLEPTKENLYLQEMFIAYAKGIRIDNASLESLIDLGLLDVENGEVCFTKETQILACLIRDQELATFDELVKHLREQ